MTSPVTIVHNELIPVDVVIRHIVNQHIVIPH